MAMEGMWNLGESYQLQWKYYSKRKKISWNLVIAVYLQGSRVKFAVFHRNTRMARSFRLSVVS